MLNKILSSISTVTNQGAPSSFKFVINDKIEYPNGLFELYTGKPKSGIINIPGIAIQDMTKLDVSIFVYRKGQVNTSFAIHAMRKLVSLRHPSILRVLDSGESDSGIYIATEHVTPITIAPRPKQVPMHALYQLAKGIEFIHEEAKLIHGTIDPVNVFVTDTGSYTLGGFELARPYFDSNYYYDKRNLQFVGLYKRIDCTDLNDIDTFGFVLLIHFFFQGPTQPVSEGSTTLQALVDSMYRQSDPLVRQLLTEISRSRSVSSQLSSFTSNETVQICDYLGSVHVHDLNEAVGFLENLPNRLTRVDENVQQSVILDLILNNVLSISSLVPAAIIVIAAISSKTAKDVFISRIQPKLIALFAIQDRSIRFRLLSVLSELVPLFEESVIEKSILVETLSGFTDSHPAIREQTLKGVVELAPKVSSQCVEKRIVPSLSKLLRDPEASIRTNAMVSVAKVATLLESEEKQKELMGSLIVNGLKDPFGPARTVAIETVRIAGVKNLSDAHKVTSEYLPLLCGLIMDKEVGRSALDTMQELLKGIEKFSPQSAAQTMIASQTSSISLTPIPSKSMALTSNRSIGSEAYSQVLKPGNQMYQPTTILSAGPSAPQATVDFDSFWDDISKPVKTKSFSYNNSLI